MKPELMLDIFHNINRTEIKLAALFDVLTSQCDRHQQNIFITKDRHMRVIDNDQVGGEGQEGGRFRGWSSVATTDLYLKVPWSHPSTWPTALPFLPPHPPCAGLRHGLAPVRL